MVDLILTTLDWVPETPRGYVRDIRCQFASKRDPLFASNRDPCGVTELGLST